MDIPKGRKPLEKSPVPRREYDRLLKAAQAAYWHLDTYGIVSGDDRQIESQRRVFEALRPFCPPIPGRL